MSADRSAHRPGDDSHPAEARPQDSTDPSPGRPPLWALAPFAASLAIAVLALIVWLGVHPG